MSDAKIPKGAKVSLESTDRKKNVKQSFPIEQANALLKLPNTKWKLNDAKYKWNGKEIAKVASK